MNLEIGNVIQLSDGLDYAIVQKVVVNRQNYLYMITTSTPVQTVIAKQKEDEKEIVLETVTDKEELDYVLYKIEQAVDNE